MYYKKDGTPYIGTRMEQMLEFAMDFDNKDYQIVKQDKLANGFLVSTVWLGLDHGIYEFSKRPLIFETMVFDESGESIECDRYSTETEAVSGHKKWVAIYNGSCKPKDRKMVSIDQVINDIKHILEEEEEDNDVE